MTFMLDYPERPWAREEGLESIRLKRAGFETTKEGPFERPAQSTLWRPRDPSQGSVL